MLNNQGTGPLVSRRRSPNGEGHHVLVPRHSSGLLFAAQDRVRRLAAGGRRERAPPTGAVHPTGQLLQQQREQQLWNLQQHHQQSDTPTTRAHSAQRAVSIGSRQDLDGLRVRRDEPQSLAPPPALCRGMSLFFCFFVEHAQKGCKKETREKNTTSFSTRLRLRLSLPVFLGLLGVLLIITRARTTYPFTLHTHTQRNQLYYCLCLPLLRTLCYTCPLLPPGGAKSRQASARIRNSLSVSDPATATTLPSLHRLREIRDGKTTTTRASVPFVSTHR